MKISIITTTFNRSLQLKRGLMTILRQENLPSDLEIIIVDDGSKDDTQSVVAYLKDEAMRINPNIEIKYIYLDHPEARISCIAKNIAIKIATGDIIIFTESENLHIDNTINQLIKKLEENPNRTPVVTQYWSMGKRIWEKLTDDEFKYPARLLSHPYAMLVQGDMQNTNAPDADFAITGSLNCFTGALFITKKEYLLEIGGFDESMTGHGFEDWDLLHRLNTYGKGVLYCNDIIAIHQYHTKDYPYNIYDAAERNRKISEDRTKRGEYRANTGKNWGQKRTDEFLRIYYP